MREELIEQIENNEALITRAYRKIKKDLINYAKESSLLNNLDYVVEDFVDDNFEIKAWIESLVDTEYEDIPVARIISYKIADVYKEDIYKSINEHLSVINFKKDGTVSLKSSTGGILADLYKEIKTFARANIEKISIDDMLLKRKKNWRTLDNYKISPYEKKYLMQKVINKFTPELKQYINKYIDKQNKHIFQKLTTYIDKNLRKIFLSFKLKKDNENNMYTQSWTDTGDGIEREYLYEYLFYNKDKILKEINVNDKIKASKWNVIVEQYLDDFYPQLIDKIYNFISSKNDKVREQRHIDILNVKDDDKIGVPNSLYLDYDITNDYVRTRPFLIVKDKNTGKDYVMRGPKGYAHSTFAGELLFKNAEKMGIEIDTNNYLGYGYMLGNDVAFIDEKPDSYQIGYSTNDVINILKNDPSIRKVYQTPSLQGKGYVTRLAKKIKKSK